MNGNYSNRSVYLIVSGEIQKIITVKKVGDLWFIGRNAIKGCFVKLYSLYNSSSKCAVCICVYYKQIYCTVTLYCFYMQILNIILLELIFLFSLGPV